MQSFTNCFRLPGPGCPGKLFKSSATPHHARELAEGGDVRRRAAELVVHDALVAGPGTPDGWRIRERRLAFIWTSGNPAVVGG